MQASPSLDPWGMANNSKLYILSFPHCTLTRRMAADAFEKKRRNVIETGCIGHSDINFSEGKACCGASDKM